MESTENFPGAGIPTDHDSISLALSACELASLLGSPLAALQGVLSKVRPFPFHNANHFQFWHTGWLSYWQHLEILKNKNASVDKRDINIYSHDSA